MKRSAALVATEIIVSESTTNGHAGVATQDEYTVDIRLVGTTPLLMHRYDIQSVKDKSGKAKGSKDKKTDDVQSYVHRDEDGRICIPGANMWSCLVGAGASVQDPRSPRKSAKDLIKASIRVAPFLSPLLPIRKTWDYLDERRVLVQRAAVPRQRPAFKEGWGVEFEITVLAAEYVDQTFLHNLITRAGRFNGLGDFRPLFGLFRLDRFTVR